MSYDGFDIPAVSALATSLRGIARGASGLHRDVAKVLDDAEAALQAPPTDSTALELTRLSVFGIAFAPPGSLDGTLTDMAAGIDRRVAQLQACEKLAKAGVPVDPALFFQDEPPPDLAKVTAAVDAVHGLRGKDFGVNGNSDDLAKVVATLNGLTSVEADLFVQQVSPEDLSSFAAQLHDTSDSGWNPFDHNGLPLGTRVDAGSALLGKIAPAHQGKFLAAFTWLQPGFDTTDVYLDGRQSQTDVNTSGIHYGIPSDPLFASSDIKNDIFQGQFGDCWWVASLTATAQTDPDFIRNGIRQNGNGTVSVRTWDQDGHEHWVTMSATLPLNSSGGIVGAHGNGSSWPGYYEKAFAILYGQDSGGAPDDHEGDSTYDRTEQGDYGAIEWDFTDKAPPYVTGSQSTGIDTSYDSVKDAYTHGHPVIVASNDSDDNVPDSLKSAYVTRHVFYVKGFTPDGKIVLGNPWGPDSPTLTVTPGEFSSMFNGAQSLNVKG